MSEELTEREIPRNPSALGPQAIEQLARSIPVERIIGTIEEMIGAVLVTGSIAKKLEAGGYEAPPDWRAREAGVKLWLSYVIGNPLVRQQIQRQDVPATNPQEELAGSPAAFDFFMRMINGDPERRKQLKAALDVIDV